MKVSMNFCIFCFAVGMIAGAVIVANNRKIQSLVKDGTEKVSDTIDDIKSTVAEQKQNIQTKMKESQNN